MLYHECPYCKERNGREGYEYPNTFKCYKCKKWFKVELIQKITKFTKED